MIINRGNNPTPEYKTKESAGFDIAVNLTSLEHLIEVNKKAGIDIDIRNLTDEKDFSNGFKLKLRANQQVKLTTGLWLDREYLKEFEENLRANNWISPYHKLVIKLYPKSSAGVKGLILSNLTGIIDIDYPDEIFLVLKYTPPLDSKTELNQLISSFTGGGNVDTRSIELEHGKCYVQGCLEFVLRNPDMIKDEVRNGGFGSTN